MTLRGTTLRGMPATRMFVCACCTAALLAACARVDVPTPSRPQPAVPVQSGPMCRVDTDCAVESHCNAIPGGCRCVNARCLANPAAVDPVIDPPPAPPASVR